MKVKQRAYLIGCILAVLMVVGAGTTLACTDVVVGRLASVDGSTITSHTVDEGSGPGTGYDCRIHIVPGQTFPEGSTMPIYKQTCEIGPTTVLKQVGTIPQVRETYSYLHSAYPFMNEHGLTMGETTISQRRELVPSEFAIMTVEQLSAVALQRCKTAREAIALMGELAEKYGFQSSCADMGECLTVVDGKSLGV